MICFNLSLDSDSFRYRLLRVHEDIETVECSAWHDYFQKHRGEDQGAQILEWLAVNFPESGRREAKAAQLWIPVIMTTDVAMVDPSLSDYADDGTSTWDDEDVDGHVMSHELLDVAQRLLMKRSDFQVGLSPVYALPGEVCEDSWWEYTFLIMEENPSCCQILLDGDCSIQIYGL